MSVTELHDFFAVLAMVALAGTLVLVVAKFVSRVSPNAPTFSLLGFAHRVQLPLAALVATVTSLGSLYFSEYGNLWQPCRFCWFQRIFMYSSAVVLIVAALRRDRGAKWYVVPLAAIGILISTYHVLLEHGYFDESKVCTVSCATPNHVSFGGRDPITLGPAHWYGVTLAVMAFIAFATILALLLLPEPLDTSDTMEDDNGEPAAG